MTVLLTGSFGNVGSSTILALLEGGYGIRCFDIPTKRNKNTHRKLSRAGSFEIIWGDIRDPDQVRAAVEDVDCIIHTAAIIPPMSDANPELAHEVNVGGTHNLIAAAQAAGTAPKLIYTSSVAVYGHPMKLGKPPRTAEDPVEPTDHYSRHKIHCEGLLRQSQLPWTIFRLGAVTPLSIDTVGMDPIMFEVPLDQRIEFVHTQDVGVACANAVEAGTIGKVLLIGGGKSCQMLYEEMVSKMMEATGIGMLPESAFKQPQNPDEYFHTDWLDTTEPQHLLRFQSRSYDQFIEDYLDELGYRRYAIRALRPIIRWRLLSKSPYYHSSA